ncbi:TRAP transporter large permease subunit, partial [Candidatus Woesearchaeota archaeon]|nr:TRAP transporter large permease subunit [Candidatus Woesearchaeota archaeon]
FLIGVFILVESLVASGIVNDVAGTMGTLSGNSILLAFIIIVTFSVLLSAFIDNIPYLVIMLPVAQSLTEQLGANPYLFFFGLLLGASIGGNVTPIGASANIVSMSIMKREGYKTTFGGFVKIGLPFTIASVVASSAFVWIFFS